jgi:hypothetical protein
MKKFINILLFLLFTHIVLTQLTSSSAEETENITISKESSSHSDKIAIIPLSGIFVGGI